MTNQIGNEKVYFNEDRFNIAPLQICIDEINDYSSEASSNTTMTMMEATAVSIVIEKGMIERNFFEVFESDSPEIKDTFSMLRLATMEHLRLVEGVWDEQRAMNDATKPNFW